MPISSQCPSKHLRHDLRINNISSTLVRYLEVASRRNHTTITKRKVRVRICKLNDSTGAFPTQKGIKSLLWLGHKIPHPRNSSRLVQLQFSAENLPSHPEASNGRCAFTRSHNQEGRRKPGTGTSLYLWGLRTKPRKKHKCTIIHHMDTNYGRKKFAPRVDA